MNYFIKKQTHSETLALQSEHMLPTLKRKKTQTSLFSNLSARGHRKRTWTEHHKLFLAPKLKQLTCSSVTHESEAEKLVISVWEKQKGQNDIAGYYKWTSAHPEVLQTITETKTLILRLDIIRPIIRLQIFTHDVKDIVTQPSETKRQNSSSLTFSNQTLKKCFL